MERRTFVTGAFAAGAYATPVTRWLAVPADGEVSHLGSHHVGRHDLEELWDAAAEARRWDSKYGGGTWRSSGVVARLRDRAVPLLHGTYSDPVGRELFAVTVELARVAGWSALDIGCHVMTTMALHATLRGYPDDAVDMAQGAYGRARRHAAPCVLAFAKLIEARAHARLGDGRSAGAALALSERLLERADEHPGAQGDEPEWISYYTPTTPQRPSAATTGQPPCPPATSPARSACAPSRSSTGCAPPEPASTSPTSSGPWRPGVATPGSGN